jgi:hypothetical protein
VTDKSENSFLIIRDILNALPACLEEHFFLSLPQAP